MNPSDQGQRLVNVRELWDHEAQTFTPWLAKHLHLLATKSARHWN